MYIYTLSLLLSDESVCTWYVCVCTYVKNGGSVTLITVKVIIQTCLQL